jgi:probable rRNA maturation factor
MTRAAPVALTIDVLVDSDRWKDTEKLRVVVRRAVARAATATLSTSAAELAIVLTDDSAIRLLNRDWRDVDAATNVLSFPAKNTGGRHLGDIVLAFETVDREARAERKPLAHHVAHLAVHGFLHLAGYDHENDDDAREMEDAERDILRQLGIPDPYQPRAEGDDGRDAKRRRTGRPAAHRRPGKRRPAGNRSGRKSADSAKNPSRRPRTP